MEGENHKPHMNGSGRKSRAPYDWKREKITSLFHVRSPVATPRELDIQGRS